jgi:hypothetical protein
MQRYVCQWHFSRMILISYICRAIVLYTQTDFQLTAQYINLMFLHASATNCSHLQGATVLEDTCSVLRNLSAVNGGIYTYVVSCHNWLTIIDY